MKKTEGKIQCLHPQGKHAAAIAEKTYLLFEKAIMQSLQNSPPLLYSDLMKEVEGYFKKNKIGFEGSVEWFGITVKNHLEAIGIIETFVSKGRKFNRLKAKLFSS